MATVEVEFGEVRRFWCPREAGLTLDSEGYLLDPEGFLGQHVMGHLATTETVLRDKRCAVLLGEPGMGKSTATKIMSAHGRRIIGTAVHRYELGRYLSEDRVVTKVFNSPELTSWREDPHPMLLILDGFDECLQGVPNLLRIAAAELADLASPHLRLVIACRTAEWPTGLEEPLRRMFGDDQVSVYELAPLRRRDVELVVQSRGADSERVMTSIAAGGIVLLAIKPVTLKMLLADLDSNNPGDFTPGRSQVELYERGLIKLCEEWDPLRSEIRQGSITSTQLLEGAGRLAAVMALSASEAVWTGSAVDRPTSDVDVSMISASSESTSAGVLSMLLRTGLFSSRGAHRLGFAHQTYMEYLAARHLAERPIEAVRQLVADGDGQPLESQRGLVAWLIAFKPQLYGDYARRDPVGFVAGGVEIVDDNLRMEIVQGLLKHARDYDLSHDLPSIYHGLNYPGLATQLAPVLVNKGDVVAARHLAIYFTQTVDDPEITQELVRIALDTSEPVVLRIAAVQAIGEKGEPTTLCNLESLTRNSDSDPDDELKGMALQVLYPSEVALVDVLRLLTPPRRARFHGHYKYFLSVTVPKSLTEQHFPALLEWVEQTLENGWPEGWLDDFWDAIVRLAWRYAHQDDGRKLLATLIVHNRHAYQLLRHAPSPREALPVLTSEVRHALALDVIYHSPTEPDNFILVNAPTPVLIAEDFSWLVERVRDETDLALHMRFLVLARYLYDPARPDHRGVIFSIPQSDSLYDELARNWIEPVQLDREDIQQLRKRWRRRDREGTRPAEELRNRLSVLLASAEAGDMDSWWELNIWLTVAPGTERIGDEFADDLTTLPGWIFLGPNKQDDVLALAQRYVQEASVDVEETLGSGTLFRPVFAGYRALALIQRLAPEILDRISVEGWKRWAGIIVEYPRQTPEASAVGAELLARAYANAPESVINAIHILLDKAAEESRALIVSVDFASIFDVRLADFFANVMTRDLPEATASSVLEILLANGASQALPLTLAAVGAKNEHPERATVAAQMALHYTAVEAWPVVWQALQEDPIWGRTLFLKLSRTEMEFVSDLSEYDLAALYLWLVGQFPPADDPQREDGFITPRQNMVFLRDRIPPALADRGTAAALVAQEKIADACPEFPWLRAYVHRVVRMVRRSKIRPLAPPQIVALLDDSERRAVHDEQDLTAAVTESLGRLQQLLQGNPTPQAFALWDERKMYPKIEDRLSDYTVDFLRRDLKQRGIIINREVEVQRRAGSHLGERTDIYVQAIGGNERDITLIVETKGCWHNELTTAMRSQLVERYLEPARLSYGIYLVFWFDPDAWNSEDPNRKKGKRYTFVELSEIFERQADELRTEGWHVRPVVIDGTLNVRRTTTDL